MKAGTSRFGLSTIGYLSSFPHFFRLSPGPLFFLPRCIGVRSPLYCWGRGPQGWQTRPSLFLSLFSGGRDASFFLLFFARPTSPPYSSPPSVFVLTCATEHPFGSRGTVHRHDGTHANSPIENGSLGCVGLARRRSTYRVSRKNTRPAKEEQVEAKK